ncbi:hypothetical protein KCP78_17425 [Salmonella enterica subsp. enterica]|nr:hypothetical protein KCP78_17425 [Salmonella enterica subsp. enterica]
MKFERHHRILKELSISSCKVSNLAKVLLGNKGNYSFRFNESLPGQGYLTAVMVVHLLPLILLITSQKNEIGYVLENMNQRRKIKGPLP